MVFIIMAIWVIVVFIYFRVFHQNEKNDYKIVIGSSSFLFTTKRAESNILRITTWAVLSGIAVMAYILFIMR